MARNSRRKTTEPALEDLADVTTALIYRAISRSGRHELARPFSALWWSGVGAGLAISLSILCKGILTALLPDTAWAPAVTNLGYSVGFLVVIMGRMQLFTENTVTPSCRCSPIHRFRGSTGQHGSGVSCLPPT